MQEIKEYCAEKKLKIKAYVDMLAAKPLMTVVQIGNIEASSRYVRNKIKDAEECGINTNLIKLEDTILESTLLDIISQLNRDPAVTGFIVQLPLPKHISEEKVKLAIDPRKDIDGFHPLSKTVAATPLGIYNYLKDMNYQFAGKNAVIIGRSNIVGRPMHKLLLDESMNVTVLHTKTEEADKQFYLSHADLIVVAAGHRHILTDADRIKPEATIFDVGINIDENSKLCGDCDYSVLVKNVAFISPVPSGCGLLTRISVIDNLLKLYENQNSRV